VNRVVPVELGHIDPDGHVKATYSTSAAEIVQLSTLTTANQHLATIPPCTPPFTTHCSTSPA
jgi:hypothetical protein